MQIGLTFEQYAKLRLRGLTCDEALLAKLADEGIVNPKRGESLKADDEGNATFEPSAVILDWSKDDIDAAAEWLYENEYWNSWTHFCWVANLRYGQAVKAHRVTCARYQLGFSLGFDVLGLVTVIKPHKEEGDYARVQFYPHGTVVEPKEEVSQ